VRSWRFLLSRRWIVFLLVVVVLAYATWWLGRWQFHRLHDRRIDNAVVERNEHASPAPVGDVLAPGRRVDHDDEWRVVSATGTYVPDETVIVRYRTREGSSGVDVVVPLQPADGPAVLVDRGWLATGNSGATPDDVPDPPSGTVTVTGWVRVDASGDAAKVSDLSTRAVSSETIGAAVGREVYGGFLDGRSEDPAPGTALAQAELPDLGEGPHFFYGLQWWFFGVLAVFGFIYLVYDEWRMNTGRKQRPEPGQRVRRVDPGQTARSMPPSTGSITPETNDAAGDSRNAAARPNSSGSP
jgi:cytochrome oxidase assembly protein ShyY1